MPIFHIQWQRRALYNINSNTYTPTHAQTCKQTHKHTHTHIHTHTHSCTHTHTHTHTHTYKQCSRTAQTKMAGHMWTQNSLHIREGSALSSNRPNLFPHKLSIWPPCHTVLTRGVHDDLNLIPAFRRMGFASLDCSSSLSSSVKVCCCLFWRSCSNSTSLSRSCSKSTSLSRSCSTSTSLSRSCSNSTSLSRSCSNSTSLSRSCSNSTSLSRSCSNSTCLSRSRSNSTSL